MKVHAACRALLLLSLLWGAASSVAARSPAQMSAGADELALFEPALDGLRHAIDDGHYRGVVGVVEVERERLLEVALGRRTQAEGEGMQADTIFQIYSMTKPVTAVAALILLDAGALALEDPVGKYLPELAGLEVGVEVADPGSGQLVLETVAAARDMTVLDLCRHTAGLTYGIFDSSPVDRLLLEAGVFDEQNTNEDLVRILGTLPLKSQPGSRFEYSLASDVLGRLVEVVSGESLDRFMQQRIFEPLGMQDTAFFVPDEKLGRLADVHQRRGATLSVVPASQRNGLGAPPRLLSGGGGLFSTAEDYVAFCNMLLGGGELDGVRILREETVERMLADQLGAIPAPASALAGGGFGLGIAVTRHDRGVGPHAGTAWWGGLAGTGFWIDVRERMVGVFMIQNMSELNHVNAFRADVYRDIGR